MNSPLSKWIQIGSKKKDPNNSNYQSSIHRKSQKFMAESRQRKSDSEKYFTVRALNHSHSAFLKEENSSKDQQSPSKPLQLLGKRQKSGKDSGRKSVNGLQTILSRGQLSSERQQALFHNGHNNISRTRLTAPNQPTNEPLKIQQYAKTIRNIQQEFNRFRIEVQKQLGIIESKMNSMVNEIVKTYQRQLATIKYNNSLDMSKFQNLQLDTEKKVSAIEGLSPVKPQEKRKNIIKNMKSLNSDTSDYKLILTESPKHSTLAIPQNNRNDTNKTMPILSLQRLIEAIQRLKIGMDEMNEIGSDNYFTKNQIYPSKHRVNSH